MYLSEDKLENVHSTFVTHADAKVQGKARAAETNQTKQVRLFCDDLEEGAGQPGPGSPFPFGKASQTGGGPLFWKTW